jgi:class 3 adenylate cyclase
MMRSGLAGWVARERVSVLIADTEQDSRWLPGPGLGDLRSAIVAPLLLGTRMLGMITLGHESPSHFSNEHLRLLEVLCVTVALAVEHTHFVANSANAPDPWSAPAGAKLPAAPVLDDPPLRPCARTIVALSAELRGLSSRTLELPPAVLFDDVLDTYFARMNLIIRRHDGVIDSIAGDTLLAIFSRPEHAAGAAIQMRESVTQLGAHWRETLGLSTGSLDIGIAGGKAAVGPLSLSHGTTRAVGPVMSVATRLRDLARGEILVAGDVAEQLHDQTFSIRALRPLRLHDGVLQPIFRLSVKP